MPHDNGGEPVKVPFFSPHVRKVFCVLGVVSLLEGLFGLYLRLTGPPYDFFAMFFFWFGGWCAVLCFYLYQREETIYCDLGVQ